MTSCKPRVNVADMSSQREVDLEKCHAKPRVNTTDMSAQREVSLEKCHVKPPSSKGVAEGRGLPRPVGGGYVRLQVGLNQSR